MNCYLLESGQHRRPGLLTDYAIPLGSCVGEQLLLQGDDSGFRDGSEISVNADLTVDAAHVDNALDGLDLRSAAALGELFEAHRYD